MNASTLFRLLRVNHWSKNLFMFLPLFFSGQFLMSGYKVLVVGMGFISFSLIASCIYIINDIRDREADRQHPEKKHRPFASGAVPVSAGYTMAIVLAALSLGFAAWLNPWFALILGVYFVMNILYSLGLKHVPILDVTIISAGFLLRIFAGGALAEVMISNWIVIMTFLLAMFLGFAKRRDDVMLYLESGQKMRKAIDGYNLEFINASMVIMAAVVIVSYLMYTMSEEVVMRIGTPHLYLTSIFVILGIIRYLQITFVQQKSGSPTRVLLRDLFIQLVLAGWILAFFIIIYARNIRGFFLQFTTS